MIPDSGVSWDYTTWLNIVFLLFAAVLIIRFARNGGGLMLKMMGGAPEQPGTEGHADHDMDNMSGTHGIRGARQPPVAPNPAGSRQSGQPGEQGHNGKAHES